LVLCCFFIKMHQSGISVNEEIKKVFKAAQEDKSLLFLKVQIDSEEFKKTGSGKVTGSRKSDFEAVKASLEEKKPCYILMKASQEGKWLLVMYVPPLAFVREKMVIASSLASLKQGLPASVFLNNDFSISSPSECTLEEYEHGTKEVNEKAVMTIQEQLKHDAQNESALSMGESKVSAMIDIPIKLSDEAQQSMDKLLKGSVDTVLYRMNPDTEVLEVDTAGNLKIEAITAKFPKNEPRFVIHNFAHDNDGHKAKAFVFFYFCPDVAKPKLKMMYSSCKGIVIKVALSAGIDLKKNIEASEPNEITPSVVLTELYPKKDEKVAFKKPTAGGGKGKSRFRGKQFNAAGGAAASEEAGDDVDL